MSMQLSVLQLNSYIKRIVDAEELLIGIGLYGEVSNFKITNGNAYFNLKEEGASISCMMFGADVVELANGSQVMLYGRLSYYVKSGALSFIARRAEKIGKGALYQKYIELKEKLEKEGIFDQKHKKEIPLFPKKIGLVTSETGAVLHDIMTVARRKNPNTDFVLYPAKVQGEGAEKTIAEGVDYFSLSDVDVVIVARGGGSFEDLAPFNTEIVARSIFACKVPVISAVGHETDVSISDFAADLRCATPSVASETAVFDYYNALNELKNNALRIDESAKYFYDSCKEDLNNIVIDIKGVCDNLFNESRNALNMQIKHFFDEMKYYETMQNSKYDLVNLSIQKDNPLALLSRGYVIAEQNGRIVKNIKSVNENENLEIKFIDGVVKTKVIKKESV